MDGNSRVKVIVAMLRNHSHIREIKSKPVVLQWFDDNAVSGISDICDRIWIAEELVSYDNRNENNADMPDVPDSNQGTGLKTSYNGDLGSGCGKEFEPYWYKHHNCEV